MTQLKFSVDSLEILKDLSSVTFVAEVQAPIKLTYMSQLGILSNLVISEEKQTGYNSSHLEVTPEGVQLNEIVK